jgi:hypothetical protein
VSLREIFTFASQTSFLKYFAFLVLLIVTLLQPGRLFAQVDSAKRNQMIEQVQDLLKANSNYPFGKNAVSLVVEKRTTVGQEGVFYFVVALILYIALMRLFFSKYISTMFTLFFRATMRQQQLREQMLQSPLPALLMNIYFVVITSAYFAFLSDHIGFTIGEDLWMNFLIAALLVSAIYIGKFIILNLCGWIFNIRQVTDTYIFIVFLTNKMIGILLLPFVVLMAFPNPDLLPTVIALSYVLLIGMIMYRFMISFRPVRQEIKLNRLHFFLYLCAFEIAPLLLIYRVLLAYTHSSF